jgi:hypothetical protein
VLILAWGCTPQPAPGAAAVGSAVSDSASSSPTPSTPAGLRLSSSPEPTIRELTPEETIRIVTAVQEADLVESHPSPNEAWLAEIYGYDCVEVAPGQEFSYQELRVVRAGEVGVDVVDSQLIACGGVGAYGLGGLFWSPDSRFFYYTDAAVGVPDGCGFWTPPYWRLDTADLQVERLGEGSLSPDGASIAAWQDGRLGVWPIDDEAIGVLEIPTTFGIAGPLAWKPDSEQVAFVISESSCRAGRSDVGLLDVNDRRAAIVLPSRSPGVSGIEWDAPYRLALTDEDGVLWRYNVVTEELRRVGP